MNNSFSISSLRCCIRNEQVYVIYLNPFHLSLSYMKKYIHYYYFCYLFFAVYLSAQEQKQSQLNEHAKLLKEIEEERLKLHEERARCEIAKTLQSKNADDTGRSRAEIDAAVKYAEVNKRIHILLSEFLIGI